MRITPSIAERLARDLLGPSDEDGPPAPTHAIGCYRISAPLGVGGMGAVYRARHDQTNHEVALKLIRPELVSAESRRRFEHETRILGRLQHPGIAQIFDAGEATTEHGTMPYFAMELVDGSSIIDYAQFHDLTTPQRLELFLAVCDAVEHAHQKGVIHRDLKPANIIVDASGRPRILDFGVARLTDSDVQVTTMQTDIGKLIGTIPYMSPEQAGGNPDDLDTRSDVYALGVILYRLLAGRLPYAIENLPIPDAVRVVRETDPTPLSSVNRTFRGDLETIVAKALVKEKERRYQSVSALASDIRRYMKNEPIEARPMSALYLLRKATRRHRSLVIGTSVGLCALIAATMIALLFAASEARARHRADISASAEKQSAARATQREADAVANLANARAVTRFLQQMLSSPEVEVFGEQALMLDVVEHARQQLDERPEIDMVTQEALRQTLAATYLSLSKDELAAQQAELALALASQAFGPDDLRVVEDERLLSIALARLKQCDRAETLIRNRIAQLNTPVGQDTEESLSCFSALISILGECGRFSECLELNHERVTRVQQMYGADHNLTLVAEHDVAQSMLSIGRSAEAEPRLRNILQRRYDLEYTDDQDTLAVLNSLAHALTSQGKFAEAEDIYATLLEKTQKRMARLHSATLIVALNYSALLDRKGDLAAAATYLESTLNEVGNDPAELNRSIVQNLTYRYGGVLAKLNRLEEAERVLTALVNRAALTYPANHPEPALYKRDLGAVLAKQKRYKDAEPLFLESFETLKASVGIEHEWTQTTIKRLVRIYELIGDQELSRQYAQLLTTPQPQQEQPKP